MSKPIISVDHLSKHYLVGHQSAHGKGYTALRDVLARNARTFLRTTRDMLAGRQIVNGDEVEEFWALKDVSFEVQPGEIVGVIGRNGAGKSTLLKVLSQITEPTSGRVTLRGRVASLLEVGTGFHPELTGRENVFLNGAILGMTRSEIRAKFDEIVAFAEVEQFLDTPVKRYSSGMYVRLAFAVAAHLEPEILVVDEVLSVGDAGFQKKCLGKMGEVSKGGQTVLFVSHNMAAVTRLCSRGILLSSGHTIADGPIDEVVRGYMEAGGHGPAFRTWPDYRKAPGNHIARLESVRVVNRQSETTQRCDIRLPVGIEMTYAVRTPGAVLVPNFHVHNSDGVCVCIINDWHNNSDPKAVGRYRSTMWFPGNFLAEGTLTVGSALSTLDPVTVHFYEPDAVAFEVADSLDGDSARGPYAGPFPGTVRPVLTWNTEVLLATEQVEALAS